MTDAEIDKTLAEIGKEFDFDALEAVCEEIDAHVDPSRFMEPLFSILESHPDADFGSPGPVVHTLERNFRKGYEAKLLASIERKPTVCTVWMLNRVINGVSGDEKAAYLAVMRQLATDQNGDTDVREMAQEMLAD